MTKLTPEALDSSHKMIVYVLNDSAPQKYYCMRIGVNDLWKNDTVQTGVLKTNFTYK